MYHFNNKNENLLKIFKRFFSKPKYNTFGTEIFVMNTFSFIGMNKGMGLPALTTIAIITITITPFGV